MNIKNKRITKYLFWLLISFSIYVLFYQLKGNWETYRELEENLAETAKAPVPHPMLIVNQSLYSPYVFAYDLIEKDAASDYWLVSNDLDPAIVLNYLIYPKKLYISESTQNQLHRKNLLRVTNPIKHEAPQKYKKVIITKENSADIFEEWAGNQ